MHDGLVRESTRALDKLGDLEPTDQKYEDVEERALKLIDAEIKHSEFADKQNERQAKLDIEKTKMDNEFTIKNRELDIREKELTVKEKELDLKGREMDLKEKELDMKTRLEFQKAGEANSDLIARRRADKLQAWWEIIKIPLGAACTGALIVLTGNVEQHAILGQHQWSLLSKR